MSVRPFSMQMVAQVVAVGAGLALALPQRVDLAHGLGHLQVQAVLGLFQLAAQHLLPVGLQHKEQIGQAAHKGHELHGSLVAAGEQIGVDAGEIIESVAQKRDDAELQLQRQRRVRKRPHRRRAPAHQCSQQRQGDQQFHGILQHGAARREQRDDQQRSPATQLAAQVGCQHRHQRPKPFAGEHGQQQKQRQMGDDRVQIPGKTGAPVQAHHGLQCQHQHGAHGQDAFALAGPFQVAEGGGRHVFRGFRTAV